jgi:hypothetical protein
MLGPAKPRRLHEPIAVSLEDLISADNFYRHLEAKLDLSFVREWTRNLYAEREQQSVVPRDTRIKVMGGLAAPGPTRPHRRGRRLCRLPVRHPIFIHRWCRSAA